MKIIISGYGRMGKTVEEVCRERGHDVVAIIDRPADWERAGLPVPGGVVIDFSLPGEAMANMERCFRLQQPIVVGTTGWYDRLDKVKRNCVDSEGTLFYAPNFSLGVNILFHVNRLLASIMSKVEGYRVSLSETHHVHKLDAPSGT
ncbi:MAG TPA: 4-hydroxy-tetrahydrodipicolinate reductase, partial [Bacteroidetes bacterium]|nr:4-hydroxy-tetrahydrodipicolinate reductase [Bacteroidota bacterium]